LLASVGTGTEPVWDAIRKGKNGIAPITAFDASEFSCQIAGEVKDFDPGLYIEKKEIKKMGRFIQFGIAAAEFALQASRFKVGPDEAERTGVYIGSGIGGFEVIEREHRTLLEKGPSRISPFFIPATIINLASGSVSIRTGAKGPNSATATACTTSAHSIGDSFRIIRYGDADVMICGGTEAAVTPMGIGGFAAMRALGTTTAMDSWWARAPASWCSKSMSTRAGAARRFWRRSWATACRRTRSTSRPLRRTVTALTA
jgi:3-oxoacyl-[acyl-carrier-protein] synthase II